MRAKSDAIAPSRATHREHTTRTHQKWRPPRSRNVRPIPNSKSATTMVRHGSRARPPGSGPPASPAPAPKCSVPLKRRPSTTYWSADGSSSARACGCRKRARPRRPTSSALHAKMITQGARDGEQRRTTRKYAVSLEAYLPVSGVVRNSGEEETIQRLEGKQQQHENWTGSGWNIPASGLTWTAKTWSLQVCL